MARRRPCASPVANALGVPTALINDARAFGFGEARLGAARGCDTAAFFTLGTGVGGAVVVGGRLQQGLGNAGELGHLTVDPGPDAPVCGCGNPGCLEAHARAAAIARLGGRATSAEVVEAARAGDERAEKALAEAGRWLGVGMANVIVALNPERIVVGGGVADAGDLLLEPARRELRRRIRVAPWSGSRSCAPSSATRRARSAPRSGARSSGPLAKDSQRCGGHGDRGMHRHPAAPDLDADLAVRKAPEVDVVAALAVAATEPGGRGRRRRRRER